MKVAIFPTMAGRRAGGVEVYEIELVRHLAQVDDDNEYHVFCSDESAIEAFGLTHRKLHFHLLRSTWRPLAYSVCLPWQLQATGCQVLHSTYIPPLWSPLPSVYTLHDTSVFDRPEFYHWRHRRLLQCLQSHGVRVAGRIICPSQTTLDLAANRFPTHASKLCKVYSGVGQVLEKMDEHQARQLVQNRFGITQPYAIYVGQLRTLHKNLPLLLEAFRLCLQSVAPVKPRLLLVGKLSWTSGGLHELIEKLGLQDQVVLAGHVDARTLEAAYSAARFLAFPSKSEGFGFTVTEAMSLGVPVIAARATSLPEVVGEAGLLVDPDDPRELSVAMRRLFTEDDMRHSLSEAGVRRAADFSWKRAAEQTAAVYRQALHSV